MIPTILILVTFIWLMIAIATRSRIFYIGTIVFAVLFVVSLWWPGEVPADETMKVKPDTAVTRDDSVMSTIDSTLNADTVLINHSRIPSKP